MNNSNKNNSPFAMVRTLVGRPANVLFISLCVILIAIKILFASYPGDFPAKDQAQALSWPVIGLILLMGLAGLLAERACDFPEPLSDRSRERRGLLWAV